MRNILLLKEKFVIITVTVKSPSRVFAFNSVSRKARSMMVKLHQLLSFDAFVIFLDCTTLHVCHPFPAIFHIEYSLVSRHPNLDIRYFSSGKDAARNRIHLSLKRITIIIELINVLITFILCKKAVAGEFYTRFTWN